MNETGIIAVDTGTNSIRAILFDPSGRIAAAGQVDNPPIYHRDGRVEQDPSSWPRALFSLLPGLSARAAELGIGVCGLSLTSQRSSVIPVDRSGKALHPAIMWQDSRTEALSRSLADRSDAVYAKSGLPISPVFSAIKMSWFKRERPDIYDRSFKLLGIQDHLVHALTGAFVTDRSLASRTNLLDLDSGEWDEELLRIFEVDRDRLCDLIDPGEEVGSLTEAAARACGLRPGIPVVSAGGDQQCAALGLGLLSSSDAVANTGTGSYVIGLTERPIHDAQKRLFCNVAAVPGRFVVEATMPTSGAIYRWFVDTFFEPGGSDRDRFDAINREVASSPPGSNGIILLPHFTGAGAPHWNSRATGVFFGIGLSTSRGDLARSVLEGVAAEMAENLEIVEEVAGRRESVRISGGLTRFRDFARMQADFFGRSVVRAPESEATAIGAWISAAVRLGLRGSFSEAYSASMEGMETEVLHPEGSKREVCRALIERRRRLYAALVAARLC